MCSVFRTVSHDTAFVVSGMMQIDILTNEMTSVYNVKYICLTSQMKNAEQEEKYLSIDDKSGNKKSWWRYRLIPIMNEC